MEATDKIIYTIGDAARIADVKPYVLRYWETEFDLLRPEKSVTGQRCYRAKDLRLVLTLKRLLHQEGFTIAGARRKLTEMSENEWEAFPAKNGEAVPDLPPGRSLEGTPDDTPQETASPVSADAPSEAVPQESEGEQAAEASLGLMNEFKSLWETSQRILNKYPH